MLREAASWHGSKYLLYSLLLRFSPMDELGGRRSGLAYYVKSTGEHKILTL